MMQSVSLVQQGLGLPRLVLGRCMSSAAQFFGNVEMAPKDPILGISERFLADTNPAKINVGVVGACCRAGRALFAPRRVSRCARPYDAAGAGPGTLHCASDTAAGHELLERLPDWSGASCASAAALGCRST